ncbi:Lon protease family protein [Denitromonas sp.]|uniref:Lon protease family protein n=1 Tax=Denitromonas sp. TaxID=2734609 RepID=UPI003A835436
MAGPSALPDHRLRTICDPATFPFDTTEQLTGLPDATVSLGQGRAEEALRFALAMQQPGYHVFVLGAHGSGRHAIVNRLLKEHAATRAVPPDLCYLHNFDDPQRPQLLTVPAGRGGALRSDMQTLIRELGPAIDDALDSETHESRVTALQEAHKAREEGALRELGEQCHADGLAFLRTAEGFVFAPTVDGEPMTPELFEAQPKDAQAAVEKKVGDWSDRLADLLDEFPSWRQELRDAIDRAEREVLGPAVALLLRPLREKYADLPQVLEFFDAIRKDLLDSGANWISPGEEEEDTPAEDGSRFHRYQIKLLVDHAATEGAPVVHETNAGFGNLIGRIEHVTQMGNVVTHYNLIRAGALHRASGGYLILDADRMFAQPYAWEGLKRALRSGEIRIEPPAEAQSWSGTLSLEPEPAPCALKVVMIGDRETFYLLTDHDPEFAELFKVAADFDDDLPRTPDNEQRYARLLTTLARNAQLLPLDRGAMARLVEEGARLAEAADRLTLHTRLISDIMREADHFARGEAAPAIGRAHIDTALAASARRMARYPEQVRQSILEGTTLISTTGERAGQVNGLVVVSLAGQHFGHPVRITATARVGEGDVVDIERETDLGGAIHSKGVLILTAFLAARYARHQPLSLAASLVFEQSYAPVEGDSASLGELCALLSSLAQVPIRQSLAVTGSVNQFGEVQAIGGVNEKIEGYYDLCAAQGLTGEQGVVIPAPNVRHLMLREDVLAAAREGRFHVYAVSSVDQAMEILTGLAAGAPDAKGAMPPSSINYKVAAALADMAARRHASPDENSRISRHRGRGVARQRDSAGE